MMNEQSRYRSIVGFLITMVVCLCTYEASSQSIKAISFNIRYDNPQDGNNRWDLRKSSIIGFLSAENPDFVGMQEVLWRQLVFLDSALADYKYIGVGRDDGAMEGEFSPIFYRGDTWKLLRSKTFWLSENIDKPSKSWDAALPRICTWGLFRHQQTGEELYVWNTHFDHKGKVARVQSAQLIVDQAKEVAGNKRTMILGDFNAEPGDAPVKAILAGGFKDAYTAATGKVGNRGTFNGFDLNQTANRRIDYIFVSSDLPVQEYSVASQVIEGRYLSDHFPVTIQTFLDLR